MTARSVPEWHGKTPDTAIPTRVKARVIDAQGGKCATCNRKMGVAGESIDFDHRIALVNGGENREANIQALCGMCHVAKTREDVREKSTTARKRAKHLGLKQPRAIIPGSRASKWKRKIGGGVEPREQER